MEITHGHKLLSQIWQSELVIWYYLEIREPVNVFGV